MKSFFKSMFASMVGTILAGIVLLIIVGLFIAGSVAVVSKIGDKKEVYVKKHSVLHLKLNKPILERSGKEDFDFNPITMKAESKLGLRETIESIQKAKKDDRIDGIYLDVIHPMTGMASMEELRDALVDFKSEGKWIVAYSELYSQGGYYLVSAADEIYLYPEGMMEWRGLNAQVMYLKDMLDKAGVDVELIRGRNNKFKSAGEAFIRNSMSEANRIQTQKYVFSLWEHILQETGAQQEIEPAELNRVAEHFLVRKAEDAVNFGLITGLKYEDEVKDLMKKKIHGEENASNKLSLVSLSNYINVKPSKKEGEKHNRKKESIAVIYASGSIQDAKGDQNTIGFNIAESIKKAKENKNVKAIVLRVNSPGGSALMSDIIWRETVLAHDKKPLVVSMGDVAASGGYYISVAADKIFASENSITGSIGVFGLIPNASELLNKKIGVHYDGVKTNKYADLGNLSRALKGDEREIIQESVEDVYNTFINRVAEGRNLSVDYVDNIAQGRVWVGKDAKEIGLVDEFGGLNKAIEAAAELAEIKDYKLVSYPRLKDPLEEILSELKGENVMSKALKEKLGTNYKLLKQFETLNELSNMEGVQARMPFAIEID